jgi:hypothetical protein
MSSGKGGSTRKRNAKAANSTAAARRSALTCGLIRSTAARVALPVPQAKLVSRTSAGIPVRKPPRVRRVDRSFSVQVASVYQSKALPSVQSVNHAQWPSTVRPIQRSVRSARPAPTSVVVFSAPPVSLPPSKEASLEGATDISESRCFQIRSVFLRPLPLFMAGALADQLATHRAGAVARPHSNRDRAQRAPGGYPARALGEGLVTGDAGASDEQLRCQDTLSRIADDVL